MPHPGRIKFHPRINNLSLFVLLETPGEENDDPAGRYRPERRRNLLATGGLLIGRFSWRQRSRRVAPLANIEDLSHPETICSHHQTRIPSTSSNLQHFGAQTEIPHVDSATHGVETPTPLFGCCLMEPVCRERCPFGQR